MKNNYLCLDVGEKRVGVALANAEVLLPRPLKTLATELAVDEIISIIDVEQIGQIVVGLPLNVSNQATEQTEFTKRFVEQLEERVSIPIDFCDEALSSRRAKDELIARGKPYEKGEVDSLAATYILDDYLREKGLVSI